MIAWLNDVREEYSKERGEEEHDLGHYNWDDDIFIGIMSESESEHGDDNDRRDDDDNFPQPIQRESERSDSRVTDFESISSTAATSVSTEVTLEAHHIGRQEHLEQVKAGLRYVDSSDDDINDDVSEPRKASGSPPPMIPDHSKLLSQPVITMTDQNGITRKPKHGRPTSLDLSRHGLLPASSSEYVNEAPDSGHCSDLYTYIPPDKLLQAFSLDNLKSQPQFQLCHFNMDTPVPSTITTTTCTCALPHYTYSTEELEAESSPPPTHSPAQLEVPTTGLSNGGPHCPDIHLCDNDWSDSSDDNSSLTTTTPAMEINIDTLDREGPGFIFIMTDSIEHCLPWSTEHRYKIASSRQPERCLLEFRMRNVDIELIWQVKVDSHLKAVHEIQEQLNQYNLHSNWFKCSLSVIMEAVSKVVRRYK